jgi:Dolichyl-phosphate-mannose-protein mannosyltransferase
LGIILLVSFLRLLHLGFPLERDEGEFGYIAQEMLRGVPMYESAYTQKLPGTYLCYALFLGVFGQSITAIHVGLLLVNVLIMVFIFLTLRETHSGRAGCIGALVFGVMALSPTVFGFAAHATFFVALFAVAGLYALLHARQRDGAWLFFWSGLCLGLAFLMKQPGIFFAPLAVVLLAADHLLLKPRRPARFARQAVALVTGALAPTLVTAVYYAAIGRLSLLWFWAFQFASGFGRDVDTAELVQGFLAMTKRVVTGFELLWILPLVGLVVMLRDRALGRDRYLYATFAAGCVLSIVPGFHFLPHYCITVLPAVALLVGALLGAMERRDVESGRGFGLAASVWALTILGLAIGVAKHDQFYFGRESDLAQSRRIYLVNPFAESIEIGEYLRSHTTPEDRIAILGSETQIFFYSQRRSVSRFVNAYFLTADHPRNREMQWEFIHDIERGRPKYLLVVNLPTSWLFQPNSPQDILGWGNAYIPAKYEVEGVLTVSREGNVLKWGADARGKSPPPSGLYVEIRRRLDPAEATDSTRVSWPVFR